MNRFKKREKRVAAAHIKKKNKLDKLASPRKRVLYEWEKKQGGGKKKPIIHGGHVEAGIEIKHLKEEEKRDSSNEKKRTQRLQSAHIGHNGPEGGGKCSALWSGRSRLRIGCRKQNRRCKDWGGSKVGVGAANFQIRGVTGDETKTSN